MPDSQHRSDDLTASARFAPSVPARHEPFPLKGCGALDWGMQSRLARIFRPESGRTVMLAIDHGYFQGPTTGLERVDLSIVPLLPLRRRADDHPGHGPLHDPARLRRPHRAARQRRAQRTEGTLRRAARGEHGGRGPDQRLGRGGAGVHRRGARDPVGSEHDPAGGRRPAVRHPGARRHRGRQGADQGRPLPAAGHQDLRRARRPRRQDLLLREGLRHGRRRVPGTAGHGWRQEAAGTRRAHHGVPRDRERRGRRGHGPQHLPERHPAGDDPRGRGGRARILQARRRLRPVPA